MNLRTIILLVLFFAFTKGMYAQNRAIDSLKIVLVSAKEDTNKVRTYIELGKKLQSLREYSLSLQFLDSAAKLGSKLNFTPGLASANSSKGVTFHKSGDFTNSLKYHQISLTYMLEGGDSVKIAQVYNNIGVAYRNLGNHPEALRNYLIALRIRESTGDKNLIADSYLNISSLYGYESNFEEALKYSLAALEGFKASGNKESMAQVYNNLALTYGNLDRYQDAIDNHLQAIKINEELGRKNNLANNYNNLCNTYGQFGKYNEAVKYGLLAIKIYEENGEDKNILASTYINIGAAVLNLAKAEKDKNTADSLYNAASFYFSNALQWALKSGNKKRIQGAYHGMHDVYQANGNYKLALENYKLHVIYKDSIYNEESSNQTAKLKIQYETEKKDREIALISKENEIKSLQLLKQEAVLRNSRLEDEKNQTRILLLNTNNEVQQLTITKTQKELAQQQSEAKAKAAELELIRKDKQLKEQQLEKQTLLRNGILFGVSLLLVVVILAFRSIQLKRRLEKQQAVTQERKRISADLHDDIGSGLSKISLLSERVRKEAQTPQAKAEAMKISEASQELSENISEIIWALNTNNDFLENLVAYIRRYASEYFENSSIRLKVVAPENIPVIPISGEVRRNIFYTVKEALHNIMKHSKATIAEIKVTVHRSRFDIHISDNGSGIPEAELNRFGNGLINMRSRMNAIHGNLEVMNHSGTTIELSLNI